MKNFYQKNKTKQRRQNSFNKTHRKVDILKNVYGHGAFEGYTNGGKEVHRLSKGKIHCSCPMCSGEKVKLIGFKASDKRKMAKGGRLEHNTFSYEDEV